VNKGALVLHDFTDVAEMSVEQRSESELLMLFPVAYVDNSKVALHYYYLP
jgi:hypothetical protein